MMTSPDAPLFPDDRTFISPETYDAFFAVVGRLEVTLDRETAALAAQRHEAVADLSRQKRQGFLELNRIMRSLQTTIPSQDLLARLSAFQKRVAANEAMLRQHMRAAQEVTDIIVRAMRDFESDGTYSRTSSYAEWA